MKQEVARCRSCRGKDRQFLDAAEISIGIRAVGLSAACDAFRGRTDIEADRLRSASRLDRCDEGEGSGLGREGEPIHESVELTSSGLETADNGLHGHELRG